MEAAGNGKASSNIIVLQNAKRSANMHRHLKHIFKDPMSGQLNSVLIKEGDDKLICIMDPDKVQELLVAKNWQHFNQVTETPVGDPR